MLLSDWRVLLRRWYISVAGLLVTAGLCVATINLVPPTYQLTAQVSLLPSTEILKGDDNQVNNPYLALGGLDGIADLVSRSMSDAQSVEAVKKDGGEGEYKIELDHSSPAPLLLLTVESQSPAAASKMTDLLLKRVPANLHDLQAASGADEKAMVKSNLLTRDDKTTTVRKAQTRALVVAGGGGLVLTYLMAALVDGALTRRRRREEGADAEDYAPVEPPRAMPARSAPAPAARKPAQARPAQARPAQVKPAQARPAEAKPTPAPAKAAPSVAELPARPAATKKRPKPAPIEAVNGSAVAQARATEAPQDGLEATLAGLLEPGDLEVPAGDTRFTDDKTGSMPIVPARTNGVEPDGHQRNGSSTGNPVNGTPVNAKVPGVDEDDEVDGDEDDEAVSETRNLVPQPSGEHRSRLDEDADLPLGGGGDATGSGRSRTLTSIRPRHSRPVPPPQ